MFHSKAPKRIQLVPDNYHTKHVGQTADMRQFFITTPFTSSHPITQKSAEYLAVFIWDRHGIFLEARIDDLGPREELREEKVRALLQQRIEALGKVFWMPIAIAPFQVERFGLTFGFLYHREETKAGVYERLEMHPGNFLSFYPPWNGEYDT